MVSAKVRYFASVIMVNLLREQSAKHRKHTNARVVPLVTDLSEISVRRIYVTVRMRMVLENFRVHGVSTTNRITVTFIGGFWRFPWLPGFFSTIGKYPKKFWKNP